MVIGIIRERKKNPDRRAPLSPSQCQRLLHEYPGLRIIVESSPVRAFSDDEYRESGIEVSEDLSSCDILLGVKEVPVDALIPEKTYLFFSHTHKEQAYNCGLLRAILEKNIRLVDYELLTDSRGIRMAGFGRYAGLVGAYNGLRGWGLLHQTYELKPSYLCRDLLELKVELQKVRLDSQFSAVVTGRGRVGHGVREILDTLCEYGQIAEVEPLEYLSHTHSSPVYTHIDPSHYVRAIDGRPFLKSEFYDHPERFESAFAPFARRSDLFIAAHYWEEGAPNFIEPMLAAEPELRLRLVADISCDIGGPIASTLRASTIENPFYGYDPLSRSETIFGAAGSIGVMAVDNLPCELPRDATVGFGEELLKNVFPSLLVRDGEGMIARATQTLKGALTPAFSYLSDYVEHCPQ
jgi:alanine dehydrogenase